MFDIFEKNDLVFPSSIRFQEGQFNTENGWVLIDAVRQNGIDESNPIPYDDICNAAITIKLDELAVETQKLSKFRYPSSDASDSEKKCKSISMDIKRLREHRLKYWSSCTKLIAARYLFRPAGSNDESNESFAKLATWNTKEGHANTIEEWNKKDEGKMTWRWEESKPGDTDYPTDLEDNV